MNVNKITVMRLKDTQNIKVMAREGKIFSIEYGNVI